MAHSGYGKRPAGDESPHADPDFAHLLPRDAEVAVFIDHLDTGHAMGHKVLAAEHPRYGQQAMRSSLTRITEAGHLRWIKEHITVEDNTMRWRALHFQVKPVPDGNHSGIYMGPSPARGCPRAGP
ncbi:hypothetical protein [Streptomyces sp. AC627_RSS907]|uniref:hypothetical protein n=1 Tax=Streptomyces sp. AC627_RSS907 TaxID=2823684 RepID=UPI0020B6AA59|nr:hypothetical protein [Streptomyces sp. AC627_RSS907]